MNDNKKRKYCKPEAYVFEVIPATHLLVQLSVAGQVGEFNEDIEL